MKNLLLICVSSVVICGSAFGQPVRGSGFTTNAPGATINAWRSSITNAGSLQATGSVAAASAIFTNDVVAGGVSLTNLNTRVAASNAVFQADINTRATANALTTATNTVSTNLLAVLTTASNAIASAQATLSNYARAANVDFTNRFTAQAATNALKLDVTTFNTTIGARQAATNGALLAGLDGKLAAVNGTAYGVLTVTNGNILNFTSTGGVVISGSDIFGYDATVFSDHTNGLLLADSLGNWTAWADSDTGDAAFRGSVASAYSAARVLTLGGPSGAGAGYGGLTVYDEAGTLQFAVDTDGGSVDVPGGNINLATGTLTGDGLILKANNSQVRQGVNDLGLGASGGLSLLCSVGYDLNWQAGHLGAYEADRTTLRPLYLDSDINTEKTIYSLTSNRGINVASGVLFGDLNYGLAALSWGNGVVRINTAADDGSSAALQVNGSVHGSDDASFDGDVVAASGEIAMRSSSGGGVFTAITSGGGLARFGSGAFTDIPLEGDHTSGMVLIEGSGGTVTSWIDSDTGDASFRTINGVRKYVALLNQTGTNAPVATVLENSLGGEVVWTRYAQGTYLGTLEGAFTASKTWVMPIALAEIDALGEIVRSNDDQIRIYTTNAGGGAASDEELLNTSIEIRVYP